MVARILELQTYDVRFPTSRQLAGSDAMNPDPDYSAAYLVLRTDHPSDLAGHGFVFTIGRGNEVELAAIAALAPLVVGRDLDEVLGDLGAFGRGLAADSQLRWLGPEKGVMHMAVGAVINAAWDLLARREGKPVWRVLADMSPEQLVGLVDFRYLTDALTPGEALEILRAAESSKADRIADLVATGYPAYTTSPGWLGYSDGRLGDLAARAVADGFGTIKLKVGGNLDDDRRRLALARRIVGPDVRIAIDANQRWDVAEAVGWARALAPFDIAWLEEPTSPDDVLAHAAIRRAIRPMRVSTGEHCQNRVMFKQLLQAGAVDLLQIDAARVGGVNENLAVLLLAKKFGVPVFPHAGGVALCELVQHLAMADYVAISGCKEDRAIEYVDNLHEHSVDPVAVHDGRYWPPVAAGFSAELVPQSVRDHLFPDGPLWSGPPVTARPDPAATASTNPSGAVVTASPVDRRGPGRGAAHRPSGWRDGEP